MKITRNNFFFILAIIIFILLIILLMVLNIAQNLFSNYLYPRKEKIEFLKTLIEIAAIIGPIIFSGFGFFIRSNKKDIYEDENSLLVTTSPEKIRSNIGEYGGKVNWINRNAVSIDDLYEHRLILLNGRMKVGKTREAAELISIAIHENRIPANRIFDMSLSPLSFNPGAVMDILSRKLERNLPVLIYIDELPRSYSGKALNILDEVIQSIKLCNNYYLIATARMDQLSKEHYSWLKKNKFGIVNMELLNGELIGRLVDNAAGIFGIQITDLARKEFIDHSDGTPAQIILGLSRVKREGIENLDQVTAHNIASKSLEITWREIRQELFDRIPISKFLFDAILTFYRAKVPLYENIVISYAYYLLLKNWKWSYVKLVWNGFTKSLEFLQPYDISIKDERILIPDVSIEELELNPQIARENLENFLLKRPLNTYPSILIYRHRRWYGYAIIKLAIQFMHADEHSHALLLILDVKKRNPKIPIIYAILGVIYGALGKTTLAADAFLKSISLDPNDFLYHQWLGESYYILNDYVLASAAFKCAINLNPENLESYKRLGDTLYKQGQLAEALDIYQKGHSIDPNNGSILYGIGNCYFMQKKYILSAVTGGMSRVV